MPITIIPAQTPTILKRSSFDVTTSVLEMPIQVSQDPQSGIASSVRTFVGIKTTIVNLWASIGGIKTITSYKGSDTFYELRAVFQGVDPTGVRNPDADIVTVWRLQPSRITKSMWMLPLVRNTMLRLFSEPGIRNWFRGDFEALVRGEGSSGTTHPTPNTPAGRIYSLTLDNIFSEYKVTAKADQDVFKGLLGSYGLGSDSWPVPAVMLSRIDIAPADASVGAAGADFSYSGRLMTTARLLRDQSSMIPLIKSRIAADPRLAAGYWLKEMPSFTQEDLNKVRVETNWTFADDYDPWLYGEPLK